VYVPFFHVLRIYPATQLWLPLNPQSWPVPQAWVHTRRLFTTNTTGELWRRSNELFHADGGWLPKFTFGGGRHVMDMIIRASHARKRQAGNFWVV